MNTNEIDVDEPVPFPLRDTVKRWMDLGLACSGLILTAPICLAITLAIKLDDPKGPVIYKQTRLGKQGKEFQIYKFRSMVADAEQRLDTLLHLNEVEGAMFKIRKDPRVTRIGRFIRKTSLDELPQLINVLKGDMSVVGPRPPLKREVEMYTSYEKQRLSVTPGCTGLWQVSGRNDVSFKEMVEMDLQYIENRSIWLDSKIIAKTFAVIFRAKDAY